MLLVMSHVPNACVSGIVMCRNWWIEVAETVMKMRRGSIDEGRVPGGVAMEVVE